LSCFQHREGIYWYPTPLCNKKERNYKVRDTEDVQAASHLPIKEYISDSSVGSDDDTPTTKRAPPKVATSMLRHTRQATGKIPGSRVADTIAATQTTEAKNKKRKRIRPTVSVDMTTISSGVETIDIGDEEDDAKSPGATTTPSARTPLGRCRLKNR
jgi:hypothetical protein